MGRLLTKTAGWLDARMEAFLLRTRSDRPSFKAPLRGFAVAGLMGAALLKYLSGPHNPLDLFVLALIWCCIVFRNHALLALGAALGLDLLVKKLEIERLGRPDLWPKFLLDSFSLLVQWAVVCAFVTVTLEKWATLRAMKRRTDDDLALAQSFQSSLSRKSCRLRRVDLYGSINQCDEVGGDFYYFRPFSKKMLNFCIGDVMGKGISASLLMAMVMSFVYEWGKTSSDPADIAARLNRRLSHLWDGRRGWFITIIYAILDEETGRLDYCAAGQKGGFLLRDGELLELAPECDPPLGAMEPFLFTRQSIQLRSGDQILLYTDGVYEAKSPSGELFGEDRLGRLFVRWAGELEGEALLNRLEQAILEHTGGIYTDDTTLLTLRFR